MSVLLYVIADNFLYSAGIEEEAMKRMNVGAIQRMLQDYYMAHLNNIFHPLHHERVMTLLSQGLGLSSEEIKRRGLIACQEEFLQDMAQTAALVAVKFQRRLVLKPAFADMVFQLMAGFVSKRDKDYKLAVSIMNGCTTAEFFSLPIGFLHDIVKRVDWEYSNTLNTDDNGCSILASVASDDCNNNNSENYSSINSNYSNSSDSNNSNASRGNNNDNNNSDRNNKEQGAPTTNEEVVNANEHGHGNETNYN